MKDDKLYVETILPTGGIFTTSSVRVEHTITIPPANYTDLGFAQALDQQLKSVPNVALVSDYD